MTITSPGVELAQEYFKVPGSETVGESGGLQAIQLAQELQPDLIILDIGLPQLNGIEAARKIRVLLSARKIIFMTENRSSEIAQEALRIGGNGYVLKSASLNHLLLAIQAVLRGRVFVNTSIEAFNLVDASNVEPFPSPPAISRPKRLGSQSQHIKITLGLVLTPLRSRARSYSS